MKAVNSPDYIEHYATPFRYQALCRTLTHQLHGVLADAPSGRVPTAFLEHVEVTAHTLAHPSSKEASSPTLRAQLHPPALLSNRLAPEQRVLLLRLFIEAIEGLPHHPQVPGNISAWVGRCLVWAPRTILPSPDALFETISVTYA